VGVPGKGCYVFYDTNQIRSKLKDIQGSIDARGSFVVDFRRRTDEIFGALFFKCMNIESENLSLLSLQELLVVYKGFIEAVMASPLITVQLFGIDACFDEDYRLMHFLQSRLKELGKGNEIDFYKNALSTNTGETVAFTEKKNFYQVLVKFTENTEIKRIFFEQSPEEISIKLRQYSFENTLFERHVRKYEWVAKREMD
jgi:hypothetical protein